MHLPAILQTLNDAKEGEKLHETQDRKHSIFNLIFEWLLHVHAMLIGYLIAVYFSLSLHCVIIHTSIAIEQWRMEMIANNTNNQFPFGINDEYQMDHISVNWIWWLFDYYFIIYRWFRSIVLFEFLNLEWSSIMENIWSNECSVQSIHQLELLSGIASVNWIWYLKNEICCKYVDCQWLAFW